MSMCCPACSSSVRSATAISPAAVSTLSPCRDSSAWEPLPPPLLPGAALPLLLATAEMPMGGTSSGGGVSATAASAWDINSGGALVNRVTG